MNKKRLTIVAIILILLLVGPLITKEIIGASGKATSSDSNLEAVNSDNSKARSKEQFTDEITRDVVIEDKGEAENSNLVDSNSEKDNEDKSKSNEVDKKDNDKSSGETENKANNKAKQTNNNKSNNKENDNSNNNSDKKAKNDNEANNKKKEEKASKNESTKGHVETGMLAGTTYIAEDGKVMVKNPNDILVLVNKHRNLPADYKPSDLVIPKVPFSFEGNDEKKYMRKEAAKALEELFNAAEEEGIYLYAVSGFRSYNRQKSIFEYRAARDGFEEANKLTAYPGQSEHQTGLAMDVTCQAVNFDLRESFGQTPEGKWLKNNAHRFGFIIRYPKGAEHITGYNYEPWHIRYVGKKVADQIYERGITLEEYMGFPK